MEVFTRITSCVLKDVLITSVEVVSSRVMKIPPDFVLIEVMVVSVWTVYTEVYTSV